MTRRHRKGPAAARMWLRRHPELAKLGVVVSKSKPVTTGDNAGKELVRLHFKPADVEWYLAQQRNGVRR